MDKVKFISHNTMAGVNDLKAACLYFDKIEVANHVRPWGLRDENAKVRKGADGKYYQTCILHMEEHFISDEFKLQLAPLIDEDIVSLKYEFYAVEEKVGSNLYSVGDPKLNISSLIFFHLGHLFKNHKQKITKDKEGNNYLSFEGDILEEVEYLQESFKRPNNEDLGYISKYFGHLLSAILRNIQSAERVLTTSSILNNYLIEYYNTFNFKEARSIINKELKVDPQIAFDAVKLAVPNISKLSVEEVLDLRYKLHDELMAFKDHLKTLQLDFELNNSDPFYISRKSNEIVNSKIKPSLDDLTSKLNGIKFSIGNSLIKEIKDPKSYSPLLLSISNNISNTSAILLSLGLISLTTALDYYHSKKEIKNSGLYYLLKLNNHTL